jgi:hypothetical protein
MCSLIDKTIHGSTLMAIHPGPEAACGRAIREYARPSDWTHLSGRECIICKHGARVHVMRHAVWLQTCWGITVQGICATLFVTYMPDLNHMASLWLSSSFSSLYSSRTYHQCFCFQTIYMKKSSWLGKNIILQLVPNMLISVGHKWNPP